MQATCGVENHDVAASAFGGFIRIKGDGGRVGAVMAGDDVDLQLIGPVFDLFVGCGTESVARAN